MTTFLAIEWSESEVSYLVAKARRRIVRVLEAESIPLEHTSDETETLETRIVATLEAALAEWKTSRLTTLIVAGRSDVDLLNLTLPPAEDRELPEMVGNMVANESSALRENALLDFVPLDDDPSQSRHVTAAVLTDRKHTSVTSMAKALGLTPHRILLRPFPAVSLFLRSPQFQKGCHLLVNVIGDEADLAVVSHSHVKVSRTVRLPSVRTESTGLDKLIAEIRRTVIVAPLEHEQEANVEGVYIYGSAEEHQELVDRIQAELGLPAQAVDAFAGIKTKVAVSEQDGGAFAPLVGAVLDEVGRGQHAIDFLNPKKPPKPPNHKRTAMLGAAAVVAAVAVGGQYVWSSLGEIDAKNQQLAVQLKELNDSIKTARKKRVLYAAVQAWERSGVNWLDELRDLALRSPSERDVLFQSIAVSPGRAGGGTIVLRGTARSSDVVIGMEDALRDKYHQIRTPRLEERIQNKKSTWQFESTMHVIGRSKALYAGMIEEPSQASGTKVSQHKGTGATRTGHPVAASQKQHAVQAGLTGTSHTEPPKTDGKNSTADYNRLR